MKLGRGTTPSPMISVESSHAVLSPIKSLQSTIRRVTLDIPCPIDIILTPAQYPYKLHLVIKGLIAPGIVGLLLGRNSLKIKGINIHIGTIDQNYEGDLIIIITVYAIWKNRKHRSRSFIYVRYKEMF